MWTNATIKYGTALAAALFAFSPLFSGPAAASGPGSAAMQMLKLDTSPRALGMAGVFAPVADDIHAMNYNPAGLGQLYFPEAAAMYFSGFEGSRLQYLAFGVPMPFVGLAGLDKPAVSASLLFSQAGDFTYRHINPDGSVSARSYDAQTDMVLSFGYGEKVYSDETRIEGKEFRFDQYLGMTAKIIRSELLDTYSATAFALDAGWLIMEPNLGLAGAVSLANFGSGIKYHQESSPLPAIVRIGLSWQKPTVLDQSFLLGAQFDSSVNEDLKTARFGLEYRFQKIFNIRLGYKAMDENPGLTFGLGIRHETLSLDFGMGAGGDVYNTSQLGMTYKFTGWSPREYRKKVVYKDPEDRPAPAPAGKERPARRTAPVKQQAPQQNKGPDFYWLY
ncbi:MAG: PorV/PorQ family protein [Elusimicrobiales bacterium]|nr:PorV/PorQ family protein [Elusimicrobiales bacterium]